ncbi:MAG TPA: 4'-phosphopantetheinyl transferase superfamily protein [Chloroflexia bacterium]|jgi:4'-phosphopantetheinyl transferase
MIASDEKWSPGPAAPTLSGNAIHVWRASLNPPEDYLQRLARTLSEDERDRSGRFYFEEDRRRFIVGRGVLREMLGRYLAVGPHELQFRYGPYGKPELAGDEALSFSVSHARHFALYAFTWGCKVGIDIEYIRPTDHMELIIERHFTAREKAVLQSLSGSRKLEAFFVCWTSKEAYLKANGRGLTQALESIDVALHPTEDTRMFSVNEASFDAASWSLQTIRPAVDYIGALAVARRGGEVSYWTLNE